ncbi:hypothetical protein ISN45_Aa03g012390 [Arabidopsis thaliana x Arabidopsis arenosa]|uniref:Reverse transcriptase domain-containing protein n=1 Tax=Arabidopsis thaliana x Arabidopsis arenosa TaxID=1240361 RepID=A0A8T2AUQ7_9BRAS|nr:hypothetical protein ISN45_Aa03g012390 [Arabidopsis thaliana x Arabidopsis arenosa]
MAEAPPLPPPPPVPPDPISSVPGLLSSDLFHPPLDVVMSDLSSSSSPPPASLKFNVIPSEKGVLGAAPSSLVKDNSSFPFASHEASSPQASLPRVADPGFNWAKTLTSSGKIPVSLAPVSISTEGRPRVKVPNSVFERGAKLHEDFIVGIFYGKAPSYGKIWGVLNFLWGKDKRVTIHKLTTNAFLFHIPSPSLRNRVLQHELWHVGDSPFFVTAWKSEFSFNPPSLEKAPVWASIKDIPFDLITPEGLSIICRPLGRAVDHKPLTSINSAEVKVIVDLTKPLPAVLEIEREDGQVLLLKVTYPWLPPLCPLCNEIGHKASLCPTAIHSQMKSSLAGKEKQTHNGPTENSSSSPSRVEKKQIWKPVPSGNASVDKSASVDVPTSSQKIQAFYPGDKSSSEIDTPSDQNQMSISVPESSPIFECSFSAGLEVAPANSAQPFELAKKSLSTEHPPITTSNSFDLLSVEANAIVLVEKSLSLVQQGPSSSSSSSKDNFFWNVRGLNDSSKHRPLRHWLSIRPVSFGAFLETHVTEASKHYILSAIGPEWTLLSNYQFSDLGKIWILYKSPTRARVLFVDLQSITCEIFLEDGTFLIYTAVYASNEEDERKKLWSSLRDTEAAFCLSNKPWMINGDFNETLSPAETSNVNIVSSSRGMRMFGDCLADLGLFDLSYSGPKFTWTNHRSGDPVAKKLDRCLVNGCWLLRFPSSHCTFEAPEFSDHTPCHIKLVTPPPSYGTRPFKFFSLLIKHPKFLDSVMEAWTQVGLPVFSLRDFCFKLKKMKRPIKDLMKENFSDLEKRVAEAHSTLDALQLLTLNDPSPINIQNEISAKEVWLHLSLAEESFFKQKSRLRWLGEGDSNTSFFHSVTAARNAKNAIKFLMKPDGSLTSSLQEVHDLAVEHFAGILRTVRGRFCPDLHELLTSFIQDTCTLEQQSSLSIPFSADAIKSCLFKMPVNKTPGPDGFPAEFFKTTWSIIGHELCSSVLQFFRDSFIPSALNSTSLVLIPKRPGAVELKDFRPISCLNTVYKIISRLLLDRLKKLLPNLILPNQTAFVKERLLMENVLLASEVVQGYHKDSVKEKITLKVDISKAFDSVRWDFLLSSLQAYKVPPVFVNWIRACVCFPSFSVSINGVTSGFFKGKTGLRQGDPLSPILFVMVMNVLSLMLNKAAEEGSFKYHPGCEDLKLTHLCFADDLLIFLEGSEESLRGVMLVLAKFEEMSGLGMNIEKTSLFCSGLSEDKLIRLKSVFDLTPTSLPIRYLGLPLCSRKLSVRDCDPLLSQIRKKLSSWTHKFLSLAGRLTLISTVISGIIGFWTSAFFLPKQVIRRINSLCSSFLWRGKVDTPSGAKVSWYNICFPKSEGGLGLRHIDSWIETCALKLFWMLFFRAGSFWVAWIRRKYLSTSPLWALNEKNVTYSWIFRKLLKLRPKALQFLRIHIGNGDSTFFWWDPWTPFGSLYHFLGSDGPTRLGIPLFSTVAEVRTEDGWSLPNARTERQVILLSFMSTITMSSANDIPVWAIDGIPYFSFSSKAVWNAIRIANPTKSWASLVWHKAAIPRHALTSWLFILNRNPTLDRLSNWGLDIELDCLLCGLAHESRNHLFFECAFSTEVWTLITQRLRISSPPYHWDQILLWLPRASASKHKKLALLQGWQGAIYELWRERNRRFHDGLSVSPITLVSRILTTVNNKCNAMLQLGLSRGSSVLQCWLT